MTNPKLRETFCAKNPMLNFPSTGFSMKWCIRPASLLALNYCLQFNTINTIEERDYTPWSPHYNYFSQKL